MHVRGRGCRCVYVYVCVCVCACARLDDLHSHAQQSHEEHDDHKTISRMERHMQETTNTTHDEHDTSKQTDTSNQIDTINTSPVTDTTEGEHKQSTQVASPTAETTGIDPLGVLTDPTVAAQASSSISVASCPPSHTHSLFHAHIPTQLSAYAQELAFFHRLHAEVDKINAFYATQETFFITTVQVLTKQMTQMVSDQHTHAAAHHTTYNRRRPSAWTCSRSTYKHKAHASDVATM